MRLLASVIIPTRNRCGALERTLRALWEQTVGLRRFEVIVVDNVSTDETPLAVERLRAQSPVPLKYCRMDEDRGPAGARNQGTRLADGSHLLFLDSDVQLDPRWIATATEYLQRNPGVGIVAGKLLYAARPARINMFGGELSRIGLAWDADEGEPSATVDCLKERLWAPSSAVMIRRRVLQDVGLFDDTFYFGFEDSDFGWRANLAGYRCVCLPDLVALHHATPSGRTAGRTIVFHYAKNRLRSMLKNYSTGSLAKYIPLYMIYAVGEMLVRPSRRERLKALAWNVTALPDTWRERGRIQHLRRRRDAELARYFSSRLLPAKTLARRRKDEWTLLHS